MARLAESQSVILVEPDKLDYQKTPTWFSIEKGKVSHSLIAVGALGG